ncbi:MAG: tetratricopeptide repeat protein [Deltaproteobacteria bacterium]|nr:tetratricopeptide repeat protein [Deltaproteobacteria bacterium]
MHIIKDLSVIVVDDSKYARDQIKRTIFDLPFQKVYEADGGFNALAIMRQRPVHLVLSDFRMMKMSGLAFLKIVKESPELKDIPFIMVLEKTDVGGDKDSLKAGVDGILVKPLDSDATRRLILEILGRTIDRDKEHMYVAMEAADINRKAGRVDPAVVEYEKAVQFKDNIASRIALGTLYIEKEDYKKSMKHFMGALKLDPNCLEAMLGMGRMFKEMGDYPKALKVLEDGLKRAEAAKKSPELLGYANFNIGKIQLEMDQVKPALESFAKAAEAAPDNQELQTKIGNALVEKDMHEEAVDYFKKAITIDPTKLHIYNLVGISLRKLNRYKEAIQQYRKALNLVPNDENVHYNIARAYYEMGDMKQAETNIRKAINLRPKFDDGVQLLRAILNPETVTSMPESK